MPSSTSSSNAADTSIRREIPSRPWLALLGAAVVLTLLTLAAWEWQVRQMGYAPTYNDSPSLWASKRALAVGAKADQVVFVGASRTLFDIDLESFREATGKQPIQLATVGSNPVIIFSHLADDSTYAGTTIVGIVPGLLAAGGGPPLSTPQRYVDKYENWSPSDRVELPMSLWLQQRLAFINDSDLKLPTLIDDLLGLPNRPAVYAPDEPPYMHIVDVHRRARLIDHLAREPGRMERIQQIWVPLFTPPPRPPVFTPEQWNEMMEDGLTKNLDSAKKNVDAITARGGRVIFVRFPSTEKVRELERAHTPREKVWDRLLRETGAPGIHFEDHPALSGFECPEWSHLSGPDSVTFTAHLIEIMRGQGLLPGR